MDRSVYEEWERIEKYIEQARELVPKATILNGALQHKGKEYTFPVATWDKGTLDASGVWPETAVPFEIKGKLTGEPPYQLSYAMNPLDLRTRLRIVETNGLLNAQLATFYKENRIDLVANFGRVGKFPLNATLKAPDFKLPADLLKLDRYSEVTGSLMGEWKTNQVLGGVKSARRTAFHRDQHAASGCRDLCYGRHQFSACAAGGEHDCRITTNRHSAAGTFISRTNVERPLGSPGERGF